MAIDRPDDIRRLMMTQAICRMMAEAESAMAAADRLPDKEAMRRREQLDEALDRVEQIIAHGPIQD